MADDKGPGPGRPSNEARAMDRMASILERMESSQKKEIGFGDAAYQDRLRAEGFFDVLEKPAFQNGREVEARGLSPQTIHRLARLKPGRYVGGRVQVSIDSKDRVHLAYKCSTPEDRMRFAMEVAADFGMLVDKIWAEMAAPAPTPEPVDDMQFTVV